MKQRKLVLAAALLCAAQAASAEDSFQRTLQRGAATHPAQYSFADLYRLTVAGQGGATLAFAPAAEAPIRVAVVQAAPQLSISDVREPGLGLLVLSGIALAAWVARRRLGYAL